jgi:hypothetical protein
MTPIPPVFLAVTLPVFVGAVVLGGAVLGGVAGAYSPMAGESRWKSALIAFVGVGVVCAAAAALTLVLPAPG